jgi:hypothetical protein
MGNRLSKKDNLFLLWQAPFVALVEQTIFLITFLRRREQQSGRMLRLDSPAPYRYIGHISSVDIESSTLMARGFFCDCLAF